MTYRTVWIDVIVSTPFCPMTFTYSVQDGGLWMQDFRFLLTAQGTYAPSDSYTQASFLDWSGLSFALNKPQELSRLPYIP